MGSHNYGYHGEDGTGLTEEILASIDNLEKISIIIDPAATDPSNSNGTEKLRRGLVMYQPAGGNYKELDAVPANIEECKTIVVLGEDVEMNAGGAVNNSETTAMGYFSAVFKKDKLFDSSGFQTNTFWADVQNGVTVAGSGAVVARLRVRTNQ
jgi:hypothetical protein